ncbi:MAG: hypothetical protein KGL38_00875 [Gemmatimonadota bacterium]|nr:hypothetical protein [Gemmatimonadota bacterium]MDE3126521.1 hypothetical protein [Gemmatimonadota bacterium]MDE3173178.1 hypothetical protein [Gemmatimonadota bacterium]MDE3216848.1 hypothetical protein [Gemmatimonadota bacterium]
MTIGDWLAGRTPAPPDALARRVRELLAADLSRDAAGAHQACEAAAEALLERLLAGRETGRETALDLLAVDALVTYAFEHAASQGDLDAEAAGAMQRIAALGARFAAGAPA